MSQENVEVVRRVYDAFNRRDFDSVAQLCTEDITWRWGTWFFESDVSGMPALERFLAEWVATFPEVMVRLEKAVGSGDKLVIFARQSGGGVGSGAPADMAFAQVMSFREGKVCDVRNYTDRQEAIEAVGLRE